MATFQVEKFEDCWQEMAPYWPLHWEELALDKERIKPNADIERYISLSQNGILQVVTAREDGKLIGYHFSIIGTHLHYKHVLMANTDMYWLHPYHRKGNTGLQCFVPWKSS